MARKTKYETNILPKLNLIEAWARDGLTDEQIAHNVGVAYSTFREYRDKHTALSAVLKKGKDDIDIQVENALLKRAMGYDVDEITQEKSGGVVTKTKVTRRHIPAEVGAIAFWLKNRRPETWRDKQETDVKFSQGDFELSIKYEDKPQSE